MHITPIHDTTLQLYTFKLLYLTRLSLPTHCPISFVATAWHGVRLGRAQAKANIAWVYSLRAHERWIHAAGHNSRALNDLDDSLLRCFVVRSPLDR